MNTLKILSRDIRGAKKDDESNCPIARAFHRQFPNNRIQVWDERIVVNGFGFAHTEDTKQFVEEFNYDMSACPQTLDFPDVTSALK